MALQMDGPALTAFLSAEFPQVADDFRVERVEAEALAVRLCVGTHHLRPGGTVSGPSIFALADVAFYLALLARIGPMALAVTTSASIDFMRKPPFGTDLIAVARVLKLGRQLAVGDVLIRTEGRVEPVARAGLTYALPPPRS